MSNAQNATTTDIEKTDLFDSIAESFGFETTAGGRKPRFRYDELTVLYDRLYVLNEIEVARQGDEVKSELRGAVAEAIGSDRRGGRPTTRRELQKLVGVLPVENDLSSDGGTLVRAANGDYPTARDLVQAEKQDHVQTWDDPEECVCVSKRQNATRYHTLWTVRNGDLVPACRGYCPSKQTPHRLAPEVSIERTKDECDYCKNGELRL